MRKPILYMAWIPIAVWSGCNVNNGEQLEFEYSEEPDDVILMDTSSLIPVEPTTLYYFPCNDCHSDLEPNTQRRELVDMHDDILFDHDSENRWCLACHDANQRDSLRLADGRLLGFNESFKLCGQCHGPKYRDWRLGIHGKRTGEWNGTKQYYLCVHCHDPHSPRFKSLKPMPPPREPNHIMIDSTYESQEETTSSP
ncbi:MAG: hypothetical protein ACWGNV_03950 [Bacteroidales bacterium]